jgi:hypothetical protein
VLFASLWFAPFSEKINHRGAMGTELRREVPDLFSVGENLGRIWCIPDGPKANSVLIASLWFAFAVKGVRINHRDAMSAEFLKR